MTLINEMKVRLNETRSRRHMFFKSIEMVQKWSTTEETLKRATLRFVEAGNLPMPSHE